MNTYRARASENRIADDIQADRDLMCTAHECPHRWSVDAGNGKLCSWHAWEPAHKWPQITQKRLDAMVERTRRVAQSKPPVPGVTRAEKTQILRGLTDFLRAPTKVGKKDWAHRIVERAEAGEIISPLVLKMARAVAGRNQARKEAS